MKALDDLRARLLEVDDLSGAGSHWVELIRPRQCAPGFAAAAIRPTRRTARSLARRRRAMRGARVRNLGRRAASMAAASSPIDRRGRSGPPAPRHRGPPEPMAETCYSRPWIVRRWRPARPSGQPTRIRRRRRRRPGISRFSARLRGDQTRRVRDCVAKNRRAPTMTTPRTSVRVMAPTPSKIFAVLDMRTGLSRRTETRSAVTYSG